MSKENNIFINILRYIAILPVAIIVFFIIYIFFYFTGKYIIGNIPFLLIKILNLVNLIWAIILANGISSYSFVFVGSSLTPFYKRIVSVILAILMCICAVISTIVYVIGFEKLPMIIGIISCIAGFIGAIFGSFMVFDEYEENK